MQEDLSTHSPREPALPPGSKRRWIDGYSLVLLSVAVATIVAAPLSILVSMDGGFRGIFYFGCLGPLLLIPLGLAIRGMVVKNPRCPARRVWSVLSLLVFLSISALSWGETFITWHFNPLFNLASLPKSGSYLHTRIEYQDGVTKSVIDDPFNKVRYCFGGPPDRVWLEGSQRIFVFSKGVILKTWTDDIEFMKSGIGIGGWMGASLEHGELQVTSEGKFERTSSAQ